VALLAVFAAAVPRTVVLICLVVAVLLRSVVSAFINLHLMTFQNQQHVALSLTRRLRQISFWRQVHAVMGHVSLMLASPPVNTLHLNQRRTS